MLDDERLGKQDLGTRDHLFDLAFQDAVERALRQHAGDPREVVVLALAGELRLAGLPEERLHGDAFRAAVDRVCSAAPGLPDGVEVPDVVPDDVRLPRDARRGTGQRSTDR